MSHRLAPVNLAKLLVPDDRFLECCEDFYKRDGFVKWADVARALGISRQAVQIRITKLRENGNLDDATFERGGLDARPDEARRDGSGG